MSCRWPYAGDNCDKTLAEVNQNTYHSFMIAYVILVLTQISMSFWQSLYFTAAKRYLTSLNLEHSRRVFILNTAAALVPLLRIHDPIGWRGILSPAFLLLLGDITIAFLLAIMVLTFQRYRNILYLIAGREQSRPIRRVQEGFMFAAWGLIMIPIIFTGQLAFRTEKVIFWVVRYIFFALVDTGVFYVFWVLLARFWCSFRAVLTREHFHAQKRNLFLLLLLTVMGMSGSILNLVQLKRVVLHGYVPSTSIWTAGTFAIGGLVSTNVGILWFRMTEKFPKEAMCPPDLCRRSRHDVPRTDRNRSGGNTHTYSVDTGIEIAAAASFPSSPNPILNIASPTPTSPAIEPAEPIPSSPSAIDIDIAAPIPSPSASPDSVEMTEKTFQTQAVTHKPKPVQKTGRYWTILVSEGPESKMEKSRTTKVRSSFSSFIQASQGLSSQASAHPGNSDPPMERTRNLQDEAIHHLPPGSSSSELYDRVIEKCVQKGYFGPDPDAKVPDWKRQAEKFEVLVAKDAQTLASLEQEHHSEVRVGVRTSLPKSTCSSRSISKTASKPVRQAKSVPRRAKSEPSRSRKLPSPSDRSNNGRTPTRTTSFVTRRQVHPTPSPSTSSSISSSSTPDAPRARRRTLTPTSTSSSSTTSSTSTTSSSTSTSTSRSSTSTTSSSTTTSTSRSSTSTTSSSTSTSTSRSSIPTTSTSFSSPSTPRLRRRTLTPTSTSSFSTTSSTSTTSSSTSTSTSRSSTSTTSSSTSTSTSRSSTSTTSSSTSTSTSRSSVPTPDAPPRKSAPDVYHRLPGD
eukprot:g24279.t1